MYDELLQIYKQEVGGDELAKLSADFYSRLADYVKRLNEEGRMLDRRTVKADLLRKEMQNARRMIRVLIQVRYMKVVKKTERMENVSPEFLTSEEQEICTTISALSEKFHGLTDDILKGRAPRTSIAQRHKRTILLFSKEVPSVIGSDMKTYGPFEIEDLASLPMENAHIMVNQGSADKVEVG
jgi:DNA replication factor GINS